MTLWIIGAIALYAAFLVTTLALCFAASRADRPWEDDQ